MKIIRVLAILVLLVGVAVVGVGGALALKARAFLHAPASAEHAERIVTIPSGASVRKIAQVLEEAGVVTDARAFSWYVRWEGRGAQVRAGELRFFTDMTPPQVLEALIKGEEVTYRITIPEGWRIQEMKAAVAAVGFLSAATFDQLATAQSSATTYGVPGPNLEGFLFPDTYLVTRRMDEEALIGQMVARFKKVWTPEFDARAKQIGLTQLEVVTLASIIEKETGAAAERPIIGSVFHNRLKKGMKLESDPTIIYGLTDYDGDIRYKDIRNPHPWNTYVIPALPPSPIASPGEAALRAALWPAETNYLFFVAVREGEHEFSETYEKHAALVEQYQRRRRAASP